MAHTHRVRWRSTSGSAGTAAAAPAFLLLAAVLLTAVAAGAGQGASSASRQKADAVAFEQFMDRVHQYVRLHKTVESGLPSLKSSEELPEVIVAHQQALARRIREARPHARAGDIFAPETRDAFRHAVRSVFQGPEGAAARATIEEGAPLEEVHLVVNEVYPDAVPYTTVSPSLLLRLPQLPDEVAYRIVGRDLVLLDVKANMVVDLMREVLPGK